MTLHQKLKQLSELREKISQNYKELSLITEQIVTEMKEIDLKTVDYDEVTHYDLVWAVNKKIDYDKMLELYPDIYTLGLMTTWNKTQALNSASNDLLNKIIKNCTVIKQGYELKKVRDK